MKRSFIVLPKSSFDKGELNYERGIGDRRYFRFETDGIAPAMPQLDCAPG
jgi:hypothetical protein